MIIRLRYILIISLLFIPFSLYSQSITSLKQQKEKREKEIDYLNKLLNETKTNHTVSMERLLLLQTKMEKNRNYMNSLVGEVRRIEDKINKNSHEILDFEKQKQELLMIYHQSIYNGWKNKGRSNMLLFILSASDFNQAYNRFKYVQQTHAYSVQQLTLLRRVNDSLIYKNQELKNLMLSKSKAVSNLDKQRKEYKQDEQNEQIAINDLKSKEKEIKRKLDLEMKQRRKLADQLNKLIAAQRKKSIKTGEGNYQLTPEEKIVSADFAKNKGRLPWPVVEGVISEKFGIKSHPIHHKVNLINDGINISTNKNGDVRAIFNGKVLSVWLVDGRNNVVIIQHGNYFTVYANLSHVYVNQGDQIKTKENIGKLAFDTEKGSILHFQIWDGMKKQNPELWIAK